MKAKELFSEGIEQFRTELSQVRQCTQFLCESKGQPLLKNFPTNPSSNWLRQVKIRHHKKVDSIIESFNKAFDATFGIHNIHQRAIFTNGVKTFRLQEGHDAFYVFPINRYNFIYNPEIASAKTKYQTTFEELQESFSDEETVKQIITELVSYTYISENLCEGIDKGAEVVFFGIPYYYAIKQSVYPDYEKLYDILI